MCRATALSLALWIALAAGPARAWEPDVHYGLVKWLAHHAGFSLEDAERVAAGSESADETHALSAPELVAELCLRGMSPTVVALSRIVQEHHFPAGFPVPNAAVARPVDPGRYGMHNFGNRRVRQEIGTGAVGSSPVVRLDRFGAALHPLADSWSHGGVPDSPPCRRRELAWSHPEARGGWSSHDADLTFKHPQDTLETAETVYRFMAEFLAANPDLRADLRADLREHPARPWSALEPRVAAFQRADTRVAKYRWFLDESEQPESPLPYDAFTTHPCFLRKLSLPRGPRRPKVECASPDGAPVPESRRRAAERYAAGPGSAAGFTRDLLETWFVKRDVERIVETRVDLPRLAEDLALQATPSAALGDADRAEAFFRMWLVEDHGAVNAAGHGTGGVRLLKDLSAENAAFELLEGPLAPVRVERLDQALRVPGDALPFLLFPDEDSGPREAYTALFRLEHAPRDLVSLRIERAGDSFRVVGMSWNVD